MRTPSPGVGGRRVDPLRHQRDQRPRGLRRGCRRSNYPGACSSVVTLVGRDPSSSLHHGGRPGGLVQDGNFQQTERERVGSCRVGSVRRVASSSVSPVAGVAVGPRLTARQRRRPPSSLGCGVSAAGGRGRVHRHHHRDGGAHARIPASPPHRLRPDRPGARWCWSSTATRAPRRTETNTPPSVRMPTRMVTWSCIRRAPASRWMGTDHLVERSRVQRVAGAGRANLHAEAFDYPTPPECGEPQRVRLVLVLRRCGIHRGSPRRARIEPSASIAIGSLPPESATAGCLSTGWVAICPIDLPPSPRWRAPSPRDSTALPVPSPNLDDEHLRHPRHDGAL